MKKVILLIVGAALLALAGTAFAVAGSKNDNPKTKVTICHATGSKTNPYVQITPSALGVIDGHVGASHQGGRDIIPPFDYVGKDGKVHSFAGQNWDAKGQAIYNNGCKVPPATPPTTTTTPTTTTNGAGETGPTVTVVQPTPGPTTTVTKKVGKKTIVTKKIHVKVAQAKRTPKTTG